MRSRSENHIRYEISHRTLYRYESDVMHAHHLLHLVPRHLPHQQCVEHSLALTPEVFRRVDGLDAFDNPVTRIEIAQPHGQLEVISRMQIDVHARLPVRAGASMPWEQVRDSLMYSGREPSREGLEAARFRHESPHVRVKRRFSDYAADCFSPEEPVLAGAAELCAQLHRDLQYAPGETSVSTSVTEVLRLRRGVCQDFAHLMIACLRSLGLPARYVSGYLRTTSGDDPGDDTGDDPGHDQRGELVGAGASHAWVAVWSPPFGWIELDPTNGCFVGTDHVALAWGRDFSDVSPLRGVILGGAHHELDVSVVVAPLPAVDEAAP